MFASCASAAANPNPASVALVPAALRTVRRFTASLVQAAEACRPPGSTSTYFQKSRTKMLRRAPMTHGCSEVGEDAVHVHLVRHVGDHQLLRCVHQRGALGAVGQRTLLLVEPVVLRQVEAREVRLPAVRSVAKRQERVAVGRTCAPTDAPHHQLAGARGLQVLRPLRVAELDAETEGGHVLAPQLDQLRGSADRAASRTRAPAASRRACSRQPSPSRST